MLSIILPCYNVARYIERAVNNLLSQNLDDYEIIIVDDGSTDNLLDVCEQWKDEKRIRIVHTENQGVSEARNTGLRIARGEYVYFMDADDWIDEGALCETMNICLEHNADGVRIGYRLLNENEEEIHDRELDFRKDTGDCIVEGKSLLQEYIGFRLGELKRVWRKDFKDNKRLSFVWSFIYKKQVLMEHDIWFEKDLQFMEDKLFLCEFLCYAKKIVRYDKVCYNYFVHNKGLRKKNFEDNILHARQRVLAEKCREKLSLRIKDNTGVDIEPMYRGTIILASIQLFLNCFKGSFYQQFKYFTDYMKISSVKRAFGI